MKEGIVKDFATLVGANFLDRAKPLKSAKTNIGLSRSALEIARLGNANLNDHEKQHLTKLLQESNNKKPFEQYYFFTNEERKRLMDSFQLSNRELATEFLDRQDGVLFETDLNCQYSPYNGLTLEEVTEVLIRVMVSQDTKNADTIMRLGMAEKLFARILTKMRLKNVMRRAAIHLASSIERA